MYPRQNYIDLEFKMELYDGQREEDLLVTVFCTGYIGTTLAMGDDSTDFYDWRVVRHTMDGIEIGDITAELTEAQWRRLEDGAHEELFSQQY